MGTTNKTTSSSDLQFNPQAESIYNSLTGSGSKVLQGYMDNPFGNSAYKLGLSQSMQGAQQGGQNNMNMLGQNQLVSGMTGSAGQGWLGAQKAQTGRANQSMMSQANIQNVMQALQRQMGATGMGMSFSPQITGSTGQQTQSTGGLGTWLPQLLGTAAGAAMGGMGGMGAGGGGGMSSVMGGSSASFPNMSSGFAGAPQGPGGFGTVPGLGPAPPPMWLMGQGSS